MSFPWFRVFVASSPSPSESSPNLQQFDYHPMVVSIPQNSLNKFIEFDENIEVYVILSLWFAPDNQIRGSSRKLVYTPGSKEVLVHAFSDTGIGIEPIKDPRLTSLPISEEDQTNSNVVIVSPFFAALYGVSTGDICHVRRIKHTNVSLNYVALQPLLPISEYDQKELIDALLSKGHIVAQGGLVLVNFPKSKTSKDQTSRIENAETDLNNVSMKDSSESSDLVCQNYLGFIVLDTGAVCQGVLTRRTTIYLLPPSSDSNNNYSNKLIESGNFQYPTSLHELYFTSRLSDSNSRQIAKESLDGSIHHQITDKQIQAAQQGPKKPLLRSSMLVVPLEGSTPVSPSRNSSLLSSPTSSGRNTSIYSPNSMSPSRSYFSSKSTGHADVLNRSLLRVSILKDPLETSTLNKSTSKSKSNQFSRNWNYDYRDTSIEVGVTLATLRQQQQGVFSGTWVEISVNSNSSNTSKRRLARIYVLDPPEQIDQPQYSPQEASNRQLKSPSNSLDRSKLASSIRTLNESTVSNNKWEDFTLYLSPIMAFNLGLDIESDTNLVKISPANQVEQLLKELSREELGQQQQQLTHNTSTNDLSSLPISIANQVSFALVQSPQNPHYSLSSKALANYFSYPRMMCVGDIFGVIVKQKKFLHGVVNEDTLGIDEVSEDENDDPIEEFQDTFDHRNIFDETEISQVVYFKITKILFEDDVAGSETRSASNNSVRYALIPRRPNAISDGFVYSRIPVGHSEYLLKSIKSSSHTKNSSKNPKKALVTSRRDKSTSQLNSSSSLFTCPFGMQSQFDELLSILKPCLHPLSSSLGLYVSVLLCGQRGAGKSKLVHLLTSKLGINIIQINCYDLIGQTDVITERKIRSLFEEASAFVPCVLLLNDIDAFDKSNPEAENLKEPAISNSLKECIQEVVSIHQTKSEPLMIIATCINSNELSRTLRSIFKTEIQISSPDEQERQRIIQHAIEKTGHISIARGLSLRDLALRTASFLHRDLLHLVQKASEFAIKRVLDNQIDRLKHLQQIRKTKHSSRSNSADNKLELTKYNPTSCDTSFSNQNPLSIHNYMLPDYELNSKFFETLEKDIVCSGITVTSDDFDSAIHFMQSNHSSSLGTPKIPQVKWEDVGGLLDAKKEILDTIQLPLQHPELFSGGISQRSGILLYGPPGTGKTLLAKAVATECNLNFISVKGPELINMYIGESEKNVRQVFQRARDARPCVIFFDELDSLAPNRGKNGDSGGVMDRIVSQLLAELSDLNQKNDVFVIGATNRPDLIDPALLIPGRFDKLIYLGVNQDLNQKIHVLKALTRKFNLGATCNFEQLAEKCPSNLTGADLYALCSDAMLIAIRSQVQSLQQLSADKIEQLKKEETEMPVVVEQAHFMEALDNLTPSVSHEELKRYQEMANQFQRK